MTSRHWTESEVAAWVDGALSPEEARRIEGIVAQDDGAQAYAEAVRKSNAALQDAFRSPLDEPVPAPIRGAIFGEPGKVATLPRARWTQSWGFLALAASVAIAVGVGAGGLVWTDDGSARIAELGNAAPDGPLYYALEILPSGTLSPDGVRPMLTFRDADDRICREFEVVGELANEFEFGVACRNARDTWHVEIIATAPPTDVNPEFGYAPASGPAADGLDATLDALEAGEPLHPEEEAQLLEDGWQSL